ncbi:translocation and assembly module lipoprotein TamL [Portibacter lacus]|uniref:Membrane protein n=1 Tax=Portibacter lacus TaxID=1099794 RepID=A0AA37WE26_9BACT|nr:BamA/TamA family outer membrane protein [Portibacter lacus]GLR18476.1 membrane protein [Portibacter lacus]
MKRSGIIIVTILLLASCSIPKYVPDDKKLYRGAEIELAKDDKLAEEDRVREAIDLAIYPKPNRKLLSLVYFNLWVYYRFDESKDKWWSKFIYNRFAEEPVYLDEVNIPLVEQIIKKEMQDEGYFNSEVTGEVQEKDKTATIKYNIDATPPTIMAKVERPKGNTPIDSLIRSFRRMSVKEGDRYRIEAFDIERAEVTEYVRSKGYFDFNSLDIYYLVDTASIDSVNVIMKIKKPANDSLHRKYFIKNVNVYTTSGALGSGAIADAKNSYVWKNLNIYEDFKFIDKKTLESNILIQPDEVFSVKDYSLTLSRLINLNIFKYVNIQYEKSAADSLDVNILLTPTLYQSARYDGELSTSDQSFLGSSLSFSYTNDNTFRRAEKFSATIRGGTELQYKDLNVGFSILNIAAGVGYEVPRLLVPFPTRKLRSSVAPKTFIKLENDYQLWLEFFNVNSANFTYGYEWRTESRFTFTAQPLFVNYINLLGTTTYFDSIAIAQPSLKLRYSDNLIIGSQFGLTHTNKLTEGQRNSYYLRWNLETSGNTSTIFANSITGVPISQYVRTDIEYRFTRKFSFIENLVTRVNFGIVKAYGNSEVAPFTKQFYMGGPTTLRGFAFRSVGPGRYQQEDDSGIINPIDQSGDIRILLNTEYRFPLFSIFRGALFFDAGNVWLIRDEVSKPEGQFKLNNFYKELAWNTGFGLRADIDFFAVRLDFGVPLYEPYENIGERWIHKSPGTGIFPWMRENIILSAGIGYPF